MSERDQFWQYAREAMISVGYANTDEDKQDLLELARIWTQAALQAKTLQERPHGAAFNQIARNQSAHDAVGEA